jgi:hypothetical protein
MRKNRAFGREIDVKRLREGLTSARVTRSTLPDELKSAIHIAEAAGKDG